MREVQDMYKEQVEVCTGEKRNKSQEQERIPVCEWEGDRWNSEATMSRGNEADEHKRGIEVSVSRVILVYKLVVRAAVMKEVQEISPEGQLRVREMRWFAHVQRRESGYPGQRMIKMKLPGRRKRSAQRSIMDVGKENMQRAGVTEEDAWIGGDAKGNLRMELPNYDSDLEKQKKTGR